MPNHQQRQTPNQKVDQKIRHAVPTVKLILIDTFPTLYTFIPVEANRLALQDSDEDTDDEIEEDNCECGGKDEAEPADDAEDAVVEENE